MRRRHQLNPWVVNSDLMTCVLGIFLLLASILIVIPHHPQVQHAGIKPKAEYLVTLTWDEHRNVDLDLWLKHGSCVIYYNNRECPDIALDRDSRGFLSNAVVTPDGKIVLSPNQEVIAIRAVLPGDYVAAVSYYEDAEYNRSADITARVEVLRLNPTVVPVQEVTLHLTLVKQTVNAIAFHVAEDGTLTILPTPPTDMISQYQQLGNHG